jgi:hypothetical protein
MSDTDNICISWDGSFFDEIEVDGLGDVEVVQKREGNLMDRTVIPLVQLRRTASPSRREAAKTALFRSYDLTHSPTVLLFNALGYQITKSLVMKVISAIVASNSTENGPSWPTRTQLRHKTGLIAWLDAHFTLVHSYFRDKEPIAKHRQSA